MVRYELMVNINGSNYLLDTMDSDDGSISIPLNYQISDIQDISTTNTSFSKTITIPDSKNNRMVFEYIFDINSSSKFDVTKKAPCYVLKDTIIQFQGYLQVTNIIYDGLLKQNAYNCIIYADNSTLFTNIGDKFLQQLNMSNYDSIYNPTSVTQSWQNDYTSGIFYPLIDYVGNFSKSKIANSGIGLNTTNFYPSMYLKPVFDQIFLEAGYTYTSDFLTSTLFKNLILPFNNAALVPGYNPNIIYSGNEIFNAAVTASFAPGLTASPSTPANVYYRYNSFAADTIVYDPNSFYNTTTHLYSNPSVLIFQQNFGINFTFYIDNTSCPSPNPASPWLNGSDNIYIYIKRNLYPDGTPELGFSDTPTLGALLDIPNTILSGGNYAYSVRAGLPLITASGSNRWVIQGSMLSDPLNGGTVSSMQPLRAGEQVRFYFTRYYSGSFAAFNPTKTYLLGNYFGNFTQVSSFFNPSITTINIGLTASTILPANVKQIDLVTSVIKLFHLYIEPDKNTSNSFRIEPADSYYKKYKVVKDWTKKLDLNQPIDSQVLSNTQLKKNVFSYTPDKDYYNSIYNNQTNQVYGQYEFDINNDFITGENDIKPIFSPTPLDLLLGSANMYLPTIINFNNNVIQGYNGMNIRLLYKNMITLTPGDQFIFDSVSYAKYPYAGPFDDPVNPVLSINYGQAPAFYSGFNDTINNCFYTYWQDTMVQLADKNNRIVTAYFYLTSTDISQFYFSDVIFFRIDGSESYYYINKIIDYDPSTNSSTKVELLKLEQI